jgi:hypothetical protein
MMGENDFSRYARLDFSDNISRHPNAPFVIIEPDPESVSPHDIFNLQYQVISLKHHLSELLNSSPPNEHQILPSLSQVEEEVTSGRARVIELRRSIKELRSQHSSKLHELTNQLQDKQFAIISRQKSRIATLNSQIASARAAKSSLKRESQSLPNSIPPVVNLQLLEFELSRQKKLGEARRARLSELAEEHRMEIRGIPTEILIGPFSGSISDITSLFVSFGEILRSETVPADDGNGHIARVTFVEPRSAQMAVRKMPIVEIGGKSVKVELAPVDASLEWLIRCDGEFDIEEERTERMEEDVKPFEMLVLLCERERDR